MKPLLAALALLLAACAAPKPEPLALRAEPVPKPVEILIETSPPGWPNGARAAELFLADEKSP